MLCYLVRHGKDDDTVRGGWSGHGLTAPGREQVHALGHELAAAGMDLERICSSDLKRARETADILADYLSLSVELLPAFRETNNGDLAGLENALADQRYPGIYWSTLGYTEPYPNGESPEMFFQRIKTAWLEFRSEILKTPTKDVLLVTHGGVIEAILCIENNVAFSNKTKHFATPNAKLIPVEIK